MFPYVYIWIKYAYIIHIYISFETELRYITQASLRFMILLLQPSKS